mgnify:CR=1 FL=1
MARKYTAAGFERSDFDAWPAVCADDGGRLADWLDALDITAPSAREWILEPDFLQGPRITPDINWMWLPDAAGEVRVGLDEQRIRVRPGDHVFLPPNIRHIEFFPMRRRWRMLSMHWTARVWGGLEFFRLSGFPLHVPGQPDGDPLGDIAQRLCREDALRAPGWNSALRAGIIEAIIHVTRHHGGAFAISAHAGAGAVHRRLAPVFEHIERRLGESGLTIGELAALLRMSTVRFRQLFREATGKQPVRFIQERRIERACWLLRRTQLSIKEAAASCGFSELTFFYRVFRRRMGISPAVYRGQMQP